MEIDRVRQSYLDLLNPGRLIAVAAQSHPYRGEIGFN